MKIINIDWTIDDENEDIILPLTMDIPEKITKEILDDCDFDTLTNYMSDQTDFLVNSYTIVYEKEEIEKLWNKFADVLFEKSEDSIDSAGLVLAEDWWVFDKGTCRDDIWHWFDNCYEFGITALFNIGV